MEIVASQSGDFARDKGRQVAETLLQAHPEATAIYAHNDEMAMGAIAALEAAGKVPGQGHHRSSRSTATKDAHPGDPRRQDGRHRRVQPELRAEGLRHHRGATRKGETIAALDHERRTASSTRSNAADTSPEAY